VICVGNVVAGGAGKTPVALAIANRMRHHGVAPHFLTRGYGGRATKPLKVSTSRHCAADVGDEALLLAAVAQTWVARDRTAGARTAVKSGADVLILDDGFQNPGLSKDISLLVVDEGFGIGNGRVLPAGPLREPPKEAVARASALVRMRSPNGSIGAMGPLTNPLIPVLTANIEPNAEDIERLRGTRVIAFAGIARPVKFFATLDAIGCIVVSSRAFDDHRRFRDKDLAALIKEADLLEARLVTTAKDAVRLPPSVKERVEVLRVTAVFDDVQALDELLTPLLP